MRCLGRLFGLLLVLLILVVTPCAFWTFNIDRVAMNPQTYKTAFRTQNFYESFLPAFIDVSAVDAPDPRVKEAARAFVRNVSSAEWAVVSEKLLPPTWLQEQLDSNIDRFFAWLNGQRNSPDISFDLTVLKQQLSNQQDTGVAATLLVPKLPPCNAEQETLLDSETLHMEDHPNLLCNPSTEEKRSKMIRNITQFFAANAETMPKTWNLAEQLRNSPPVMDEDTGRPVSPETILNRIRSFLWLDSRLVILGFLVPIALFAIVIIVAIRSSKQFFRWLGWGLILSGILTLIPVPFLSGAALDHTVMSESSLMEGGQIVGTLAAGIITSILAGINLMVFTQVAIVIVIGIVALFLSVLLPRPDEVTRQELAFERSQVGALQANLMFQMGNQMGSTPRPYESAPITPPPVHTPAPAPKYNPADLDDLFADLPTGDESGKG